MKAARSIAFALAVIAAAAGCASSRTTASPATSPITTTVVVPPGSTVAVVAPAPVPWCGGSYVSVGGTNFGSCR